MDVRMTDHFALIRLPESKHARFNLAQSGELQDA
jgi:hypothetical protein